MKPMRLLSFALVALLLAMGYVLLHLPDLARQVAANEPGTVESLANPPAEDAQG